MWWLYSYGVMANIRINIANVNFECNSERILKIGQLLPKLRASTFAKVAGTITQLPFFDSQCILRPFVRDYLGEPVPEETFTH